MSKQITIGKIRFALTELTDPVSISTLTKDHACNTRLNKCMYWMHQAALLGLDVETTVADVVRGHPVNENERELTVRSFVRNYHRVIRFGCETQENLRLLRNGYSALITRGSKKGEKLEIDHIIPRALMPGLAKKFYNLKVEPHSTNRKKSDRLGQSQLRHVQKYVKYGFVPPDAARQLDLIVRSGWSVRRASRHMPTAVLALREVSSEAGSFPVDPQHIIARVFDLVERIHDWEPRGDSAISNAETVQRQTAEHVTRLQSLLGQAKTFLSEAHATVSKVEAALRDCSARCQTQLSSAKDCEASVRAANDNVRNENRYWTRELKSAENWQAGARRREDKARSRVERAEAALDRANGALRRAEEQLEKARNRRRPAGRDSNGKTIYEPIDTTSFENRVSEAEDRVRECQSRLADAEQELRVAEAEREAADARVESCGSAIAVIAEAEQEVNSAFDYAKSARQAVDRAFEEYARAALVTKYARGSVSRAERAVERVSEQISTAASHESEAATFLHAAQGHHACARERSALGCMEIDWRMEQLRIFDRHM